MTSESVNRPLRILFFSIINMCMCLCGGKIAHYYKSPLNIWPLSMYIHLSHFLPIATFFFSSLSTTTVLVLATPLGSSSFLLYIQLSGPSHHTSAGISGSTIDYGLILQLEFYYCYCQYGQMPIHNTKQELTNFCTS